MLRREIQAPLTESASRVIVTCPSATSSSLWVGSTMTCLSKTAKLQESGVFAISRSWPGSPVSSTVAPSPPLFLLAPSTATASAMRCLDRHD